MERHSDDEPPTPMNEALEALTALGALLSVMQMKIHGGIDIKNDDLVDHIENCLIQHRRAASAIREAERRAAWARSVAPPDIPPE